MTTLPPLTDEQIVKIAREVCDRPIQRQDAVALARAVIAASLPEHAKARQKSSHMHAAYIEIDI